MLQGDGSDPETHNGPDLEGHRRPSKRGGCGADLDGLLSRPWSSEVSRGMPKSLRI